MIWYRRAGRWAGWLTLSFVAIAGSAALVAGVTVRGEAFRDTLEHSDVPALPVAALLLAVGAPLLTLALRLARPERSLPASESGSASEETQALQAEAVLNESRWHDEPRVPRVPHSQPDRRHHPRHAHGARKPGPSRAAARPGVAR